jgi:hypothetical protein
MLSGKEDYSEADELYEELEVKRRRKKLRFAALSSNAESWRISIVRKNQNKMFCHIIS